MALNTSLIAGVQSPKIAITDPVEQFSKGLQLKNLMLQNQTGQQAYDDQNALRSLFSGGIDLNTPEGQAKLYGASPMKATDILKGRAELNQSAAKLDETKANTTKALTENTAKAIALHRDQLAGVNDPQSAAQWMQAGYADPQTGKIMQSLAPLDQALARIPTDPAKFQQWKQEQALGATKFIELNKPKTDILNNGGANQVIQSPGLGGAPQTVMSAPITQSANSIAQNETLRLNNAATNATSRANNAATNAKDYTIAGVGADGTPSASVESMAQQIAAGKLGPITGFALARPQGQQVMARVAQINPNYDATEYGAKAKAAKDFSTGNQGNAMRSFAVAGQHLDQLGELVDALNNKNMPVVNMIGNAYSKQTGSPVVTNFEAAKDVASKEVIKAIVAGGGGVAEREELKNLMANANSPAQLKGVIAQYRGLMGAQHDALLQQRRAAGLSDSTLPDYKAESAGAPQTFDKLPDPSSLKGRKIQGPNGVMQSDGTRWMMVK